MNDKTRPLVHEVCSDCFRACPQDLSLRYILPHKCRSPGFHRRADRVFVTCFKGVLVRVPPPDNVMAGLRGRFVMCQAGQKCKRSRCSYPHTEEERDFWNSALEDFKVCQRPISIPPLVSPVQHVPVPPPQCFPPPPPLPLHHHHHPFVPHQPFLFSPPPVPHGRLPLTHPSSQHPAAEQHWPNIITPQPPYSSGPLLVHPPAESLPTSCAPPPVEPPTELPHTKPRPVGKPGIRAPHVSEQHHSDAALPLTRETYKKKFTALLYLEEEVHNKLLKDKCNDEYLLLVKPRERAPRTLQRRVVEHVRYAHICGMSGDQMMYAAQASQYVRILDPENNHFVAKADIPPGGNFNRIGDKLSIAFTSREASNLEKYYQIGEGYHRLHVIANFEVNHRYFDLLRRAVNSLTDQAIKRIMPTEEDFATGLDLTRVPLPKHYDSLKLDKEHQFRALQLVLFSRSLAPVIIPGPFGTGKTRILAVAAYNFLEYAKVEGTEAHILVCCHHQVSADTFVENYFGDVFKQEIASKNSELQVVRLTRMKYYVRNSGYEQLYVRIDDFCDQAEEYRRLKYLVVVTTLSTALNIGDSFGDSFFTHILLDEGAQVREPEAVAPLCMANEKTKIVIAGDSQQVGPALLVLGEKPNELGLGTSLLERLQNDYKKAGGNHKDYIAHLRTNHRCHEDILDLPSQLFYNSSLLSRSTAGTFPCAPYPLVFICSSVADPQPDEEDISEDEADILIGLFRQFSRKGDTRSFQEGTCFMALSRRQVTLLNHSLTKQESFRVKCFPSYEIQGREFKALFISTVECVHDGFKSANPTKSFCNCYVFNTALTRAQSLVVVTGNPFLLLKVEAAMPKPKGCWREYLRRCIDHNTFIVPKHFDNESTVLTELKQLVEQHEKVEKKTPSFTPREVAPACTLPSAVHSENDPTEEAFQEILNTFEQKSSGSLPGSTTTEPMDPIKEEMQKKSRRARRRRRNMAQAQPSSTTPSQTLSGVAANVPDRSASTKPNPWLQPPQSVPATPKQEKEQPSARHVQPHQSAARHTQPHQSADRPAQSARNVCHETEFPSLEEAAQIPSQRRKPPPSTNPTNPSQAQSINRGSLLHRFEHKHQQRDIELLKADLTVENYKSRFHQLLCREEDKHESILRDKCDGLYTLTVYHHGAEAPGDWRAEENEDERDIRYGYLSADDLDGDKVAYAEQACENEGNLAISYNGKEYHAKMVLPYSWKKNQDCIYIRMPKVDALKLRNLKSQFVIPDVYVMFELKYSYFDRLHKAVDLLSHTTVQRLIPVDASWFSCPGKNPTLFRSKRYKEFLTLDCEQLNALEMIVYAEPKAPVVVAGSFGTGKTQMLAQAAFQIFTAKYDENPRVLVCAHHQASANAFLTKYFGPMKEQGWKVSIVRMIMYARMKEIDERYRQYCRTSSSVAKNLHKIQLVVTTFANCLHLAKLLKGSADCWFTHILIDEGAQTREPETIAPLFMCGPKTVVAIAGDHKQVGPSMLVLGDDPLKYGLGQSLLERLHNLYSTQTHTNAEHHCATLLQNYRCHRSLLALPSYLFYHSTLIASKNASKQALLHPDTTYSLHFICSSLNDTIVEVQDSTNRDEAVLLLEAAAKYVREWPPEWGNRELKTVCVMATTANQQNLIRKTMRSTSHQLNFVKYLTGHAQDHNSVEILKAYDMQGREFQCVFLSTAEPTTAEGASKNPTKTPCSQYVFNTALTRAKSLVVCAGNPFLLMKIEENTPQNRDKRPFWAEYIRRCIENETFIVPGSLQVSNTDRQDKLSKLIALVFKSDSQAKLANSLSDRRLDSITMAYKKAFESLPNLQRCKVELKYAMGGMQWQVKEDKDDSREIGVRQESLPNNVPQYNLEVVTYRKALAHPLNANKPVVTLNGLGNRKGAFDGDVVAIELYEPVEQTDKTYGKVIGVIQKCHQERYVCRVDRHSTLHFHPIDRKTPTFVNLPRISRDLLKFRREDIEAGLKSQHQWVVVFEEDSIPLSGEDNLPRIKEIITAESANKLLFIVQEIGWDPEYRLPLGAVVESLPLGTNLFHAERLLRAAYSVFQDDFDKSDEEKKEESHENVEASVELPASDVVCQAFTIDPSDARNLDDALSLVRESDDTYTMSVHIANVGGQLEENSTIDKRAQSRGNSVYGFFRNMLPAAVCQQFSLSPKRVCNVLTVSTTATVEKDGTITVADSDPVIKVGKVQSQVQLDYSEAQLILDQDPSRQSGKLRSKLDQYPSIEDQPDLPQSLDLLFKIAMHLRVKRLGRAAYAYDFSEEEVEESWQAHLLVEELMVWANSTVAKYVFQHLPNFTVLRRQGCPPGEEIKELFERFAGVLGHSVGLSRLGNIDSTDQPFLVPRSTMLELQRTIENRNTFHLQQLLTSDYLYPQLAAATAHLRAISQRAEYVCSKSIGQLPSDDSSTSYGIVSPFRHYSLCLDYYTHFTSPIRRFCDVVVQRLLLSILNNTECSYSVEQLEKLCRHFNIRFREAKQFQKEKNHLDFAKQFGESCEETHVYVHRNRNRFEVSFPELKYKSCLKWQKAEFHVSALVCEEQKGGILKWKAFMFSFNGNDFILDNPKVRLTVEDSEDSMVNMTVFYRSDSDGVAIDSCDYPKLHLKKATKDQDRLKRYQTSSVLTQDVIAIDAEKWKNIIAHVDSLSEDTMQQLSDVLIKPQPVEKSGNNRATSVDRERFEVSPILKYEVKQMLGSNSIIPVWLGQTLLGEPILTPCLQLMEVAPELRICLQHNTHPAECFSDPHFGQASKAAYTSLEEYVRLWEKVFLAEVAEDSVQDRDKSLTILKDVLLQWPNLKIPENSTDEYFIPEGLVKLTIPPEKRDFLEYNIRIKIGDLVCIRYDVKEEECRAVYHLVVENKYAGDQPSDDIEEQENKEKLPLVVTMKYIGRSSCQISPRMADVLLKHQPTCELQVINLQESYNRVYKLLVSLKRHSMRHTRTEGKDLLVHLVARGDIKEINRLRNPLMKKALDVLTKDPMAHTLWSHGVELNTEQKEAIKRALMQRFQLIQGPPGTGKSETGAHIAYIFAQLLVDNQCVVYCAPSNKAVDVVHDKLCQVNEKLRRSGRKELKLLRLYGKMHEKIDFPGPYTSHGYLAPAEGEGRCEEMFRPYALHHLIRKNCSKLKEMEDEFEKMRLENTVPAPQMLIKYKRLIRDREREIIGKRYHVILGTCNECAGARMKHLKEAGRVAQVIVDECGMAHEPETIAAVSMSNHVVLIGDHKQLQPVVKLTAARENGLSTSLFQRYAESFEEECPLIALQVQYRMHSKICEFPSNHFYKSTLRPDHSVNNRCPMGALQDFWPSGLRCPIVFCDVVGKEGETPGLSEGQKGRKTDPHSKCNTEEAKKAVEVTRALRRRLRNTKITIAVLTPYRAQRDLVLDQMSNVSTGDKVDRDWDSGIAKVLTINESQGDEYDYVILTTVRSQPLNEISNPDLVQPDRKWLRDTLGFVTDPHQVNVAITRAKQGLIIVGNHTLLEYDNDTWKPLIEFYKENNCVISGSKFPR